MAPAQPVTLIDAKRPPEWVEAMSPEDVAKWLGLGAQMFGSCRLGCF